MKVHTRTVDVPGPAGAIRALVAAPAHPGRWPAVLFSSDIFQLTAPHVRLARRLAGHGFVVVAHELYGRFEPAGTVLDFEKDRQRALDDMERVRVEEIDADRDALLTWVAQQSDVDPARVAAAGWCFGGHLAFRAAADPRVKAVACCYPTTIHLDKLGATAAVDSLAPARLAAIAAQKTAVLLVWGRDDPHIPPDGRSKLHRALEGAGVRFEARLFDAEHTFMRDEGARHDPHATDEAFAAMLALFRAIA
jgi:carboxymethylenebutenolidase